MNHVTKRDPFNDWDPFRELEEFQTRLGSLFGRSPASQEEGAKMDWAPTVDILEDDEEYLIKADLPEVRKEDIQLTIENRVLLIRGERKLESDETRKRYHRSERRYGAFLRSFSLPENADVGSVRAEFRNGLLKVHIAKAERPQPRQIQVHVAGE